ncbi:MULTISPECIES: YqcC family protein [unclassified Ketobacter]|uniref:YqcC family protein n=1 Tax=unclassified Ketobacter TaxID=2639109 RepID=UPI000F27B663|nr:MULTISPECIES: YqcC family protein [unclassified Ketobacter]RLT88686.1 MAG: YqcC family protein [Ketobacter sp. GenoA1]RLT97713.1 MAG: YqcC family protein [Ketobacter sp.]
MADRTLLLALLINLETEMREMGLWEPQSPPASAFDSQVPFCYDTMNFAQWLQWVFIARFRAILEGGHPLPQNCDVAPMAEECFSKMELNSDAIVSLLRQFDQEF